MSGASHPPAGAWVVVLDFALRIPLLPPDPLPEVNLDVLMLEPGTQAHAHAHAHVITPALAGQAYAVGSRGGLEPPTS
ncbi:hypothetical protein V866_002378 [Kwoniella sp. B9012]